MRAKHPDPPTAEQYSLTLIVHRDVGNVPPWMMWRLDYQAIGLLRLSPCVYSIHGSGEECGGDADIMPQTPRLISLQLDEDKRTGRLWLELFLSETEPTQNSCSLCQDWAHI